MSSLKLNGWAEMMAFGLTATFCSIMILGLFFAIWFYRNYPEQKALLDRAHQQHELLMSGDDCGLYGDYPPADLS